MSQYYLIQDSEKCIGCLACQVSCKVNKWLRVGPALCQNLSVGPIERNGVPYVRFVFMPCFHCEDPWCLRSCPTSAIKKREKDGIVYIDPALCIGCKSCISACPWGACQWDPETHKAVKCDYCMSRVDQDLKPACVTRCLTQCLHFGDASELPEFKRKRYARELAMGHYSPHPSEEEAEGRKP